MTKWYVEKVMGMPLIKNPSDASVHGMEIEVKYWRKPLGRYALKIEIKKGRNVIISRHGFTQSALDWARRYRPDIELWHHNEQVQ
jgi:hypothetical protein